MLNMKYNMYRIPDDPIIARRSVRNLYLFCILLGLNPLLLFCLYFRFKNNFKQFYTSNEMYIWEKQTVTNVYIYIPIREYINSMPVIL